MSKVLTLGYEYEHDYILLGINSTLEDYRLAYFLNKSCSINLERQPNNIDFKDKNSSFTFYNFDCAISFTNWSLVANKNSFSIKSVNQANLFNEETKTSFLINEKKEVDFFLKIFGDLDETLLSSIQVKINKIHGVLTSFKIDPISLKSKDYLIF